MSYLSNEPHANLVAESVTDLVIKVQEYVDADYKGKLSDGELRVLTALYAQRLADVLVDRSFRLRRGMPRGEIRAAVAFPEDVLEALSEIDALIDEGKL